MLERIFKRLQQEQMICLNADNFFLNRTVIKVHPDGTGALKKMARSLSANPAAAGQQNCILLPHLLNVRFSLGQARDALEGRRLLTELGGQFLNHALSL